MTRPLGDPDRRDDVELDDAEARESSLGAHVRGDRVAIDSVDTAVRALRSWVDEHPMAWRQASHLAGDSFAARLSRAEILERAARQLTLERKRLRSGGIAPPATYSFPKGSDAEVEGEGEPTESERIWASFEMDGEPNDLEAEIVGDYEPEEVDAALDGDFEAEEIDAGAEGEWVAEQIDAGAEGQWAGVEREDEEAAQAATLQRAAVHGTPLCAECERLEAAQSAAADASEERPA